MSNDVTFDYQHTCKKSQPAYLKYNAPFKSVKVENHVPFLGEGYYFWEENQVAADRWGIIHYKNNYSVVEYKDWTIRGDEMLNFLNRRDSNYFNDLKNKFIIKNPNSKKWFLAQWIEFFKSLKIKNPEIFPYLILRADEYLPDGKENDEIRQKISLSAKGYYSYTNPLIIICVIDKNNINCTSKSILK